MHDRKRQSKGLCRDFEPWLELPVNNIPLKMLSKLGNVDFWVQTFSKKKGPKGTHFYEFSGTKNDRPLY